MSSSNKLLQNRIRHSKRNPYPSCFMLRKNLWWSRTNTTQEKITVILKTEQIFYYKDPAIQPMVEVAVEYKFCNSSQNSPTDVMQQLIHWFLLYVFSVASTSDVTAFCAYMSTTEHSPSLHHVLVFDDVRTNIGSAFNRISGMFTAPIDGVYVFTWTIFSDIHSYVFSQIVVNTEAFTSMVTDGEEVGDYHSSTGVVVVSLKCGDVVYIRTHPTHLSHGNIHSDRFNGSPSFSGWKLWIFE